MTRPFIAVVGHRREMDTPLGRLRASLVYDAYLQYLFEAGASTALLSPAVPIPEPVAREADGLLLIGGGDVAPERFGGDSGSGRDIDEERDRLETKLVLLAQEEKMPTLGMCRGAQLMNVALGGTLSTVDGHVQQNPLSRPHHPIEVAAGSRTATIVGEHGAGVNSFHRWAVDEVAPGMAVSATAPDEVIEAFESEDDWFAIGIQWHAELLDAEHVRTLFETFVTAARERGR